MKRARTLLYCIVIAFSLGSLAAITRSKINRQDLYAKWYLEISKSKTSINKLNRLSRDFESEYFNKDFPAYFHSSSSEISIRADVFCRFRKETQDSILYACNARANADGSTDYERLEAWIYRISIPGYEKSKSRMSIRLVPDYQENPAEDFVDPINHPEGVSPEVQHISIPVISIPTGHNYEHQRTFDVRRSTNNYSIVTSQRDLFYLLVLGSGLTAFAALEFKSKRRIIISASIILTSLAMLELTSIAVFTNPLPRNYLTYKWKLLDVADNIYLGLLYQKWTEGLRGQILVRRVWNKAHQALQHNSSIKMLEEISPKYNGLLFGQSCKNRTPNSIDILVVGASVAEGWHASQIRNTAWNIASQRINKDRDIPVCIGVKARGGIHSDVELEFVREFLDKSKPKAIILIHSQNDVINPVFNVAKQTMGVNQDFNSQLSHSADKFLAYSSEIRRIANKKNVHVFEFMPPSAMDKKPLTNDEKTILIGYASSKSYDWTLPGRLLNSTFDRIASNLRLVDSINGEYTFVDGRRAFEGEYQTMFSDIWHFGDAGHEIFGTIVADIVNYWLTSRPPHY